MSFGQGGIRPAGSQYLRVVTAVKDNLDADIFESDGASPNFYAEGDGFVCDLNSDLNPRALFLTPSADVEIRMSINKTDGASIYFRVESPTKMWRIAFGDIDPIAIPIYERRYGRRRRNWRWRDWWDEYYWDYWDIWEGRRWWIYGWYGWWFLDRYEGHVPAVPGYCVKNPPYQTYDQANQCVCVDSSQGYTVYKSNQEPDYDFEHQFKFQTDCGGNFCHKRKNWQRNKGCEQGCIESTKITPYYCIGGTPAQYIPRYEEVASISRVYIQYRNGSSDWTTLYQQELKGKDVKITARGTKVDVYYGDYATDKWTFDATFQDTVTSSLAIQHGVGAAGVSEDFDKLSGGIKNVWIQTI